MKPTGAGLLLCVVCAASTASTMCRQRWSHLQVLILSSMGVGRGGDTGSQARLGPRLEHGLVGLVGQEGAGLQSPAVLGVPPAPQVTGCGCVQALSQHPVPRPVVGSLARLGWVPAHRGARQSSVELCPWGCTVVAATPGADGSERSSPGVGKVQCSTLRLEAWHRPGRRLAQLAGGSKTSGRCLAATSQQALLWTCADIGCRGGSELCQAVWTAGALLWEQQIRCLRETVNRLGPFRH